ncbi:MAG: DUF6883 domain-containing protein [Vicinamibacterales bacterium]
MELPNAERATVDLGKITDYLLNAGHPENGGKARFFGDLGFARAEPAALANALRALAVSGDVVRHSDSRHGRKFVVDGAIQGPHAREAIVRTVWIIDAELDVPRLVTAYPGGV